MLLTVFGQPRHAPHKLPVHAPDDGFGLAVHDERTEGTDALAQRCVLANGAQRPRRDLVAVRHRRVLRPKCRRKAVGVLREQRLCIAAELGVLRCTRPGFCPLRRWDGGVAKHVDVSLALVVLTVLGAGTKRCSPVDLERACDATRDAVRRQPAASYDVRARVLMLVEQAVVAVTLAQLFRLEDVEICARDAARGAVRVDAAATTRVDHVNDVQQILQLLTRVGVHGVAKSKPLKTHNQ
mmetsp:Transcript_19784/g.61442  ORF Transcript_19784/g.61442 Transcript_19784/m.61442 type:complete len:239 (+) Transcript_19784:393-1109(+)